jgi:beta-glucosidase
MTNDAPATLADKVRLLSGADMWRTLGDPRLGVAALKVTDGPNGARGDMRSGSTSASFPVGVALGASFDPDLLRAVGAALAEEAKTKACHVLLGPTINLQRTPLGGRHFECFSEDPLLTGVLAAAFVEGVQSRGVAACPKHFVCNDQEFERHRVSVEVSERALREIYLAPFEHVVRAAQPWTIMTAYNRINGVYAASHQVLLKGVLKGEFGFDGVAVSDWGGALDTMGDALGGLDLEMPGPSRIWGDKLIAAVERGDVLEADIDDKIARLRLLSQRCAGAAEAGAAERSEDRPEHRALALAAAAAGTVLLKNEGGLLPLAAKGLKRLAVIGPNAAQGQIMGGGSSRVEPHYVSQPLDAIRAALAQDTEIIHEPGCRTWRYAPAFPLERLAAPDGSGRGFLREDFNSLDFDAPPRATSRLAASAFSSFDAFAAVASAAPSLVRLSGDFTPEHTGAHTFGIASAGLSRVLVDGVLLIDNWTDWSRGETFYAYGSAERRAAIELEAGRTVRIAIEFAADQRFPIAGLRAGVIPPEPDDLLARAAAAAAASQACVLVLGTNADWETEGSDRADLRLPGAQDALAAAVLKANPRTIVVLNVGGPVEADWFDAAPAVLVPWFAGQEFGAAIAAILFGEREPGGRLPFTWPRRLDATPAAASYPGENLKLAYSEDLAIGHRWFDAHGVEPLAWFGQGLSYARIVIDAQRLDRENGAAIVVADVRNLSERSGSVLLQAHVRAPEGAFGALRRHCGFLKLALGPGETKQARIILDPRALQRWDVSAQAWIGEPGPATVELTRDGVLVAAFPFTSS